MAYTNATSVLNAYSQAIEERLAPDYMDSLPKLDWLYDKIITSWAGVGPSDLIGRAYEVIHTFFSGVTGSVKWLTPGGAAPSQLGTSTQVQHNGNYQSWPTISEGSAPGLVHKKVTLARMRGSLYIPLEVFNINQLSPTRTNIMAMLLTGFVRNIGHSEVGQIYATSTKRELGTVGAWGAANLDQAGTAVTGMRTAVIKNHSVRLFAPGQMLDVYDSSGATKKNIGMLQVASVRYKVKSTDAGYGRVTLQAVDGSSTADATGIWGANTPATGDLLVLRDSISQGIIGPDQWLVDDTSASTTIFNIDVKIWEQFQSIVDTSLGTLTETKLNQLFSRYERAYGWEDIPDVGLMTRGVANSLEANDAGLARFMRNGERLRIRMGYDLGDESEPPYYFGTNPVTFYASPFMPSDSLFSSASQTGGRLWCLKTRDDNLVRYVPPPIEFAKDGGPFAGAEIQFPFGHLGPYGIFNLAYGAAGELIDQLHAACQKDVALCPKVIPGIKAEGVTELN